MSCLVFFFSFIILIFSPLKYKKKKQNSIGRYDFCNYFHSQNENDKTVQFIFKFLSSFHRRKEIESDGINDNDEQFSEKINHFLHQTWRK